MQPSQPRENHSASAELVIRPLRLRVIPLVVAAVVGAASLILYWGTALDAVGLIVAFAIALGSIFLGSAPGRKLPLTLEGTRLLLGGRPFGTLGDLVGAAVDRASSRTHLTLLHRRRPALVAVLEAGDAEQMVGRLGFHGAETAVVLSATRPIGILGVAFAMVVPFLAIFWLLFARSFNVGDWFGTFCAVVLFVPLGTLALLLRTRVSAADDGVCIETLARPRFVAMRDVVSVQTVAPQTIVRLAYLQRGKERTELLTLANADAAARLVARIAAARTRHETRRGDAHVLLQRAEDPADVWLARIVRIADREGYRHAGTSPERIEELLQNPAAEPTERAAAARILMGWDRAVAPRVRVVAEATSDPKLRESLVRLADAGDDETLDEALRRFAMTPR
jgi:hypothetical protein